MLSEILEQNKSLLEKRDSYLLPHLDKMIDLVNTLEKNASDDYFDAFERRKLHKGECLLQEGTVCRFTWFLEKGMARVFDRKDGMEVTRYFYSPAEFIDVHSSAVQQIPSNVTIQVIQDSVVYAISRDTVEKLATAYPAIYEIEKLVLECHFFWLEHRMFTIQHSNVTEQYLYMLHQQAPLIRNISVTHIASYLGVSIETVSRIRRKVGGD